MKWNIGGGLAGRLNYCWWAILACGPDYEVEPDFKKDEIWFNFSSRVLVRLFRNLTSTWARVPLARREEAKKIEEAKLCFGRAM